jgi:hypothetical protein
LSSRVDVLLRTSAQSGTSLSHPPRSSDTPNETATMVVSVHPSDCGDSVMRNCRLVALLLTRVVKMADTVVAVGVLLLAVLAAAVGLTAGSQAQAPDAPLTPPELRARVAALEQDLAGLRKDYQLLLTTCQSPAPAPRAARAERSPAAVATVPTVAPLKESKLDEERRVDNDSWYVQVMDYVAIETSAEWTRYGWTVKIKNGIRRPQTFDLVVQFLDKDGLVIDSDQLTNQTVAATDEQTMQGNKAINMPGAIEVVKVNVIATRRPDARSDRRR